MVVLTKANAYPGGQKITIATWFKVLDVSADNHGLWDHGNFYGAGYDFFSNEALGGEYGDDYVSGASLIPICEWGYGAEAGFQALSGFYIYPKFSASDHYGMRFVARGPFYGQTPGGFGSIDAPQNGGIIDSTNTSGSVGDSGPGDTRYPTEVLNCFITDDKPGWSPSGWNFALVSADISTPDFLVGPTYSEVLGQTTTVATGSASFGQGSKIWMNVNTVFDTAKTTDMGILTPSLPDGSGQYLSYSGRDYQLVSVEDPHVEQPVYGFQVTNPIISMMAGEFAMPCRAAWASSHYNYARVVFAYTQAWFNMYISPSAENYSKFYVPGKLPGTIKPAPKLAASNAFGTPDVFFYRDKRANVPFTRNNGLAGVFTTVGTPPTDYTPGPGQ